VTGYSNRDHNTTRWRPFSFQVLAGKNRQLDGCAADLGKVVEAYHGAVEGRHIMLAWGAGQFQSSCAPTSQIQRAMSRLCRVVEVDEAYTSSYFSLAILFFCEILCQVVCSPTA
jgi:hypothetical protein